MLPANKSLPVRKLPKPPAIRHVPIDAMAVAGETELPFYAVERLRKMADKAKELENILSKQE